MNGFTGARAALAVGVIAMLAMPAAALAGGNGKGPRHDHVAGSTKRSIIGTNPAQTVIISVAAKSGPSGENPAGLINVINKTRKTHVLESVQCLRVQGNLATAGAVVTKSDDPLLPKGSTLHWWFSDHGPAALRKDGAFSTPIGSVVDPLTCPTPVDFTRDDDAGGYVIHDAQP
jgi:hypothetical protein